MTIDSSAATAVAIETSQSDKRLYKSLKLDNGLQCLLISDSTTDKASAAMDVRVGHLSDPSDVPGLAHFLEHMLFMGTTKYPDENDYNVYLNQNGGSSNAFTDMESTNYFFDVAAHKLEGALDRFAQFFVSPLLNQDSTDREMQAVDSEHAKNLQNDMWRSFQLTKTLCRSDHPFSKFGSGNSESLKVEGIRSKLLEFYSKYYSANLMKLVVLGSESLDELEQWVRSCFGNVPNQSLEAPKFPGEPFTSKELAKVVRVVPVGEHRTVEMHFPLREVDSLYLSKPTRYLSHLLGHEGAGSVLSLLKHLGWANELSAGESRSCTDWASFSVSIELTEEGLERYEDVVQVVFSYLELLKQTGPQKWIHDETATVADCSFRFLSKRNPMDYTSSLAGRMQIYPEQHVLSGPYKIYQYEPSLVTEILEKLVPTNMLLMVTTKSFEGQTTQKEKWYGTDYSVDDIKPELLEKWAQSAQNQETEGRLQLPERNDMIATNFDLRDFPTTAPKDEPRLLMDTTECRLWYKPDNVFDMPKVNVMAHLRTKTAYDSPQSTVLALLWVQTLQEHCNEFTYLASMAGLHCDFSPGRTGVEVHVSGYNHKVHVLLERIVKAMVAVPTKVSDDLFDRIKDKVSREYENFAFAQPCQHAFYAGDMVLEHEKWSMEDKMGAVVDVTRGDLMEFSRRLLARFHLEILVHGNASPDQVKQVASIFLDGLKPSTPFASHLPQLRVVQLQASTDHIYRLAEFNDDNTNSCLEVVFQMGPMDLSANATLSFLHHLMKEPAFNELRTEEQLGYIVHTAVKTSGDNIKGLLILIQSDSFDPIHLDDRVEAFVDRFRTRIVGMSPDEFQSNIDAVVKSFLEKVRNG